VGGRMGWVGGWVGGRMGVGEWVWEDGCGRMGHGRMGVGEWVWEDGCGRMGALGGCLWTGRHLLGLRLQDTRPRPPPRRR